MMLLEYVSRSEVVAVEMHFDDANGPGLHVSFSCNCHSVRMTTKFKVPPRDTIVGIQHNYSVVLWSDLKIGTNVYTPMKQRCYKAVV